MSTATQVRHTFTSGCFCSVLAEAGQCPWKVIAGFILGEVPGEEW